MNEGVIPTSGEPKGELVIRTPAMPSSANAHGDIFGGWLMSQMDVGGSILAVATAKSRVVTIAVDSMTFLKPVYVGDLVTCYASIGKIGNTSIRVDVEVWVHRGRGHAHERVTQGSFTYVAVDTAGKPHPVKRG
jgi:acyl-CoA thioesterase YciA